MSTPAVVFDSLSNLIPPAMPPLAGTRATLFNSDGTCTGAACAENECCIAPQACADSSFSSDAKCDAGDDSDLTVFNSDGTCSTTACTQADCCSTVPEPVPEPEPEPCEYSSGSGSGSWSGSG